MRVLSFLKTHKNLDPSEIFGIVWKEKIPSYVVAVIIVVNNAMLLGLCSNTGCGSS